MILIYEFDLDILKLYLLTKNEVSMSMLSKVTARTGRTRTHTDKQTDATKHIISRIRGWKTFANADQNIGVFKYIGLVYIFSLFYKSCTLFTG